jgi:hypothetical protein
MQKRFRCSFARVDPRAAREANAQSGQKRPYSFVEVDIDSSPSVTDSEERTESTSGLRSTKLRPRKRIRLKSHSGDDVEGQDGNSEIASSVIPVTGTRGPALEGKETWEIQEQDMSKLGEDGSLAQDTADEDGHDEDDILPGEPSD